MEARRAEWKSLNLEIPPRNMTPSPARSAAGPCGALIQSGGVLYFTDEEKYWINWPLSPAGTSRCWAGSSFRPSRMTARRSLLRSARTARLFSSTTARSGTTGAGTDKNCRESLGAFPAQLVKKSFGPFSPSGPPPAVRWRPFFCVSGVEEVEAPSGWGWCRPQCRSRRRRRG